MKVCYNCRNRLMVGEKPDRDARCHFCGRELKVCLNCRFYDRFARNQCLEHRAEPIEVKDRANFCEFFTFRNSFIHRSAKDDTIPEELADILGYF